MFYSQTLLSRKGSLKPVWVAAYCHKKLKKDQVAQTDISSSVDDIVLNAVTVTYRVLGYLLLGVVRIYSKKVQYLFDDCQDVVIKIRTYTFSDKNKLPKGAVSAPYHSITLPDNFELDAFDLEDVEDMSRDTLKSHDKNITLEDAWEVARNDNFFDMYQQEETAYFGISTLDEPMDDIFTSHTMDVDMEMSTSHDLSSLEASIEFQRTQLPPEEPPDLETFSADELQTPHSHSNEGYNSEDQIKLSKMTPSATGKLRVITEEHPVSSVDRTPDNLKTPNIYDKLGTTSPEFMVIPTPGRKEQPRKSRKRKCLYDEVIVLSNKVVRQTLHDSSQLVCKRRKAPETAIEVWRASTVPNLGNDFLKPLILGPSWLGNLFREKNYDSPQKGQVDKGSIKSRGTVLETSCDYSDEHGATDQFSVDQSSSFGLAKCTTTNNSDKMGTTTPDENEKNQMSDSDIRTPDLGLNLTDEEIGLHTEEHQSPDGWSVRTRKVANYLADSFQDKKNQDDEEVLNIAPVVEGRSRKENARLFYELLVLKTMDVIDVKQETPYGDIVMLPTSKL